MPLQQGTTRSSLAPAEKLSHRLIVRDSARPARSHPLPVVSERRLDLGLFQDLGRGATLNFPQSPKLRERHNRGSLAA